MANSEVLELFRTRPQNRQQIQAWCRFFMGYEVQSQCRCRPSPRELLEGKTQHQSQLDYLESAFLNQHSACVFMATRNGGKSLAAAAVDVLDCLFKPGIKIAVVGYIAEHAQFIAKYILKFLQHIEQVTGYQAIIKSKYSQHVKNLRFQNGSLIMFFSGGKSESDVSGFRPNVVQIDEADKFEEQKFNGIGNALEGGGSISSRLEVLSTNYTMDGDGVILKQIEKYERFNATRPPHMLPKKVFRLCLLDILANCDDRFECSSCQLWTYCKGKAKEVKTDGYYRIEEAISKAIDTSRPNFEAEFLLLRPSSEYSYFPEFSVAEHILDPEKDLDPTLLTCIAFDFGHGRSPQAAVIMQKREDGTYYVIDEFLRECDLEVFCELVKDRYPQATTFDCFYDPYGNRKDAIKGSKTYADVLKRQGFFPRCRQIERKRSFEMMHRRIAPAAGPIQFFVNKRCRHLIQQIQSAEHTTRSGKILPEPADKPGDDLLDCTRYIIGWTEKSTYARHHGVKQLRWFK